MPKALQTTILEQLHDSPMAGHLGKKKTQEKVSGECYWTGWRHATEQWCRKCPRCASRKGLVRKEHGKLHPYAMGAPMEQIAIDILGPLPRTDSGNRYLLVALDYFTNWPEAFAIPDQEATTVAPVLTEGIFCRFGVPLELHSDQGKNFESTVFQEICRILDITKTRIMPGYPQSDGMVERMNRTLLNGLSMLQAGGKCMVWKMLVIQYYGKVICAMAYETTN
jgi:hypothetical protein